MTKRKKLTIALVFPLVLALILFAFALLAAIPGVGRVFEGIFGAVYIFSYFEHFFIGDLLYSAGIGSRTTVPNVLFGDNYPLGWVFALAFNYIAVSAVTYLALTIYDKLRKPKELK